MSILWHEMNYSSKICAVQDPLFIDGATFSTRRNVQDATRWDPGARYPSKGCLDRASVVFPERCPWAIFFAKRSSRDVIGSVCFSNESNTGKFFIFARYDLYLLVLHYPDCLEKTDSNR